MTARISDELEKAWELLKAEGEQEGGKEGGGGGGGVYATPPPSMEDLIWLKTAFTALEEGLDAVQLTAVGGGGGGGGGGRGGASSHPPLKSATLGPQKLQELLREAGLSGLLPQDYAAVVSRLERTINFLMDAAMNGGGRGGAGGGGGGGGGVGTGV